MLALAQQRGAGEDDGEDGDVVDDLNHRQEPAALQVGVEQRAGGHADRAGRRLLAVLQQLALKNPPQVTGAHKGLAHGGGVDVELHLRLAAGQQVALEVGRHVEDESEVGVVQGAVHLVVGQRHGRLELRWQQGVGELAREGAAVLVDDRHAGVVHAHDRALGRHVDGHAEGIQQEDQQHAVVAQAGEFFQAEAVDVRQTFHLKPPAFSARPR